MTANMPPMPQPDDRAKDEGGAASFVRILLTAISYLLMVPPWGFITWLYAFKIISEYERGVIFRLGRLVGSRGPGLFVVWPIIERMVKVDLRTVTMDVPGQECITRDNVTVKVNAVIFLRVVNPDDSVTKVIDHFRATSQISQTTLRSVLGQSMLDSLLSEREEINDKLQKIIDEQTAPWGVKVSTVEVKDVELPQGMQRAMARQAEAERERRAKVINAEGELQASEQLAEAGRILAEVPTTMQLRFLQTLAEIATEKNSTIIFPVPIDLIRMFAPHADGDGGGARPRVHVGAAAGGEQPKLAPAGPPPVPEPPSREGTVS